jgi:hypothetical protein
VRDVIIVSSSAKNKETIAICDTLREYQLPPDDIAKHGGLVDFEQ